MPAGDPVAHQLAVHSEDGTCAFCRRAELVFIALSGVSGLMLALVVISDSIGQTPLPLHWTGLAMSTMAVTAMIAIRITSWHESSIILEHKPVGEEPEDEQDHDGGDDGCTVGPGGDGP